MLDVKVLNDDNQEIKLKESVDEDADELEVNIEGTENQPEEKEEKEKEDSDEYDDLREEDVEPDLEELSLDDLDLDDFGDEH